jgi:hypothetical protein
MLVGIAADKLVYWVLVDYLSAAVVINADN